MRTFHIGGTARIEEQSGIEASNAGTVRYQNLKTVDNREGKPVAINRNGALVIVDREGRERERYNVVYGADARGRATATSVERGPDAGRVGSLQLRRSSPTSPGTIQFHDIEAGVTMKEEVDEVSGLSRQVIIQSPGREAAPAAAGPGRQGQDAAQDPAAGPRHADGPGRRARSRRATCWPRSRARRRRPRTSPAVCRAWSICSRRGTRRTRR